MRSLKSRTGVTNQFKTPSTIQRHSDYLTKVIESAKSYEHRIACYNMVENSLIILRAVGYEYDHVTAWGKSMRELIKGVKPF